MHLLQSSLISAIRRAMVSKLICYRNKSSLHHVYPDISLIKIDTFQASVNYMIMQILNLFKSEDYD